MRRNPGARGRQGWVQGVLGARRDPERRNCWSRPFKRSPSRLIEALSSLRSAGRGTSPSPPQRLFVCCIIQRYSNKPTLYSRRTFLPCGRAALEKYFGCNSRCLISGFFFCADWSFSIACVSFLCEPMNRIRFWDLLMANLTLYVNMYV